MEPKTVFQLDMTQFLASEIVSIQCEETEKLGIVTVRLSNGQKIESARDLKEYPGFCTMVVAEWHNHLRKTTIGLNVQSLNPEKKQPEAP